MAIDIKPWDTVEGWRWYWNWDHGLECGKYGKGEADTCLWYEPPFATLMRYKNIACDIYVFYLYRFQSRLKCRSEVHVVVSK
jgi:hypothetical protein